jgi:hypothetical protein
MKIMERFKQQFEGGDYFLGISIDQGWEPIVFDACQEIEQLLTPEELQRFHWVQIKEKFGGLQMYWQPNAMLALAIIGRKEVHLAEFDSGERPGFTQKTVMAIREIVARAREQAGRTCEICGEPGRLYPDDYWMTLCERHARQKGRV